MTRSTSLLARLCLLSSTAAPGRASHPGRPQHQTLCPGGLTCYHHGRCATGDREPEAAEAFAGRDVPWYEVASVKGEHCVGCKEGWGGVDCGRRVAACDNGDPAAPACFNGGQCYKKGIGADGRYEYMCDCSRAGEDGVEYAGRFCQHEKEEYCDEEMFCTNGGRCSSVKDAAGTHQHFACACPDHRAGAHCEFLQMDGPGLTECRLDCERGTCAKGVKSYDHLAGTGPFPAALARDVVSPSGEHCVCPDGYTGLRCEVRVQPCGHLNCYHGAACARDDRGRPVCDCNAAHTAAVSYAGAGCEQESTARCAPSLDQDSKDAFCTNRGRCIEDPWTRHEGCVCDAGWAGDTCELPVAAGEPAPICDLECNGGSCRFGVKGYKDSLDALNLPVHAKKQENGMFCSCPDGYTGLHCEVNMRKCPGSDSEHFCLNGASCSEDNTCQCGDGLAGRFCEHAVTQYCTEGSLSRHTHSFCTNGGRCKTHNGYADTEHHGCCCPNGYEGDYCQFPKGTLAEDTHVTWSPLEHCPEAVNLEDLFSPNADGEWPHIVINPKFQVPSHNDKGEEHARVTAKAMESEEPQHKSSAGSIVTSVLVFLFVTVGLASVAYRKRTKEENEVSQFAADWWKDHASEWWKGETTIEAGTNIAPATISRPGLVSRSWSYPEETQDSAWEYSRDHGDLHDVEI